MHLSLVATCAWSHSEMTHSASIHRNQQVHDARLVRVYLLRKTPAAKRPVKITLRPYRGFQVLRRPLHRAAGTPARGTPECESVCGHPLTVLLRHAFRRGVAVMDSLPNSRNRTIGSSRGLSVLSLGTALVTRDWSIRKRWRPPRR